MSGADRGGSFARVFSFGKKNVRPACAVTPVAGDGRALVVRLSGEWRARASVPDASFLEAALAAENPPRRIVFDAEGVTAFDSALPAFVLRCRRIATAHEAEVDTSGLPEGVLRLLRLALARPEREESEHEEDDVTFLHVAGEWGVKSAKSWLKAVEFVGATAAALVAFARGRARCRKSELLYFIQMTGVDALPIVTLISFLTGLIMAYVGSVQLRNFGATIYVANLVGLAMVREMGVLMTGVILCGRTGTAYAAQLGSMNASEETSAFRVLGVNPVEFLVLPRLLALALMMPLLTLYSNFVGMIGGLVVVTSMDVTVDQYVLQLVKAINLANFCSGLIKSVFFGVLIAWAGCFRGMTCGRSSLDVGNAATGAAVLGITLIIVADAVFAVIFNVVGYF